MSVHSHHPRQRHGLLGVHHHGALVFPGSSHPVSPRPSAPTDLTAPPLAAGWAEEEVLLWFASPTGLLSGQVPADLLDTHPGRVQAAVAQVASGTLG